MGDGATTTVDILHDTAAALEAVSDLLDRLAEADTAKASDMRAQMVTEIGLMMAATKGILTMPDNLASRMVHSRAANAVHDLASEASDLLERLEVGNG
jgi:hypothetical protein